MSEELAKQLSSYKAQLQQVEVALSTDPENEDLQKLQKDLQVCVNTRHQCTGYTPPALKCVVLLNAEKLFECKDFVLISDAVDCNVIVNIPLSHSAIIKQEMPVQNN